MRNVCGRKHFCVFEIFCELLQPFRKVSQSVFRVSIVVPLFFVLSFLVNRDSFLVLDRHFALLLDLLKIDLTSPAVAM